MNFRLSCSYPHDSVRISLWTSSKWTIFIRHLLVTGGTENHLFSGVVKVSPSLRRKRWLFTQVHCRGFFSFFFEQVDTLENQAKTYWPFYYHYLIENESFGSNKWVLIITTPCFRSQNMCICGHKSRKLLFCKSLQNTKVSNFEEGVQVHGA